MFCMKCGQELPDDAVFCYKCGRPTNPDNQESMFQMGYPEIEAPRKSTRHRAWLIIALVFVLIFFIGAFGRIRVLLIAILPAFVCFFVWLLLEIGARRRFDEDCDLYNAQREANTNVNNMW